MSMGPFYENVTNRDFRMYFNGALIYIYGDAARGGCVYMLNIDREAPSNELAHDTTHTLDRLTNTTVFPAHMHLLGSELFLRQDIRIHRMPIEYLPLHRGIRRVSAEPTDRRAFKGTAMNMVTALPVVEAAHPMTRWEWDSLQEMVHRSTRMSSVLADCITRVLNIGFARCMSALVLPEVARQTTRTQVLSLLTDRSGPMSVVPDFPVAIVRINKQEVVDEDLPAAVPSDRNRYGLVLYRGFVVGTVHEDRGALVFTGRDLASESDTARRLRKEGVEDMTTRMFADSVVWSLWEAPPVDRVSVYTRMSSPGLSGPFAEAGMLGFEEADAIDWPEEEDEDEEYEDDE